MSIDTSVTTAEPGTTTQPDPDGSSSDVAVDDDYSTEAGGPTMIWLFTAIFVVVTWLRRRHRKRRQQR